MSHQVVLSLEGKPVALGSADELPGVTPNVRGQIALPQLGSPRLSLSIRMA